MSSDHHDRLLPAPDTLQAMPERIVLHWTAGARQPSMSDLQHYHVLIGQHGQHIRWHQGVPLPNNLRDLSTTDATFGPDHPEGYAAHTRGLNSWSMGLALCGMRGAKREPFDPGREPITELQVKALVEFCATACDLYGLEPTARDILTHCEVPRVYMVEQPGKWDIEALPVDGELRLLGKKVAGDRLRALIHQRRQA